MENTLVNTSTVENTLTAREEKAVRIYTDFGFSPAEATEMVIENRNPETDIEELMEYFGVK